MVQLDACASFCASVHEVFGPEIGSYVVGALAFGLAWWKAHRAGKVAAVAVADASKSRLQLAELKGSMRPVAMSLPSPNVTVIPADARVPMDLDMDQPTVERVISSKGSKEQP